MSSDEEQATLLGGTMWRLPGAEAPEALGRTRKSVSAPRNETRGSKSPLSLEKAQIPEMACSEQRFTASKDDDKNIHTRHLSYFQPDRSNVNVDSYEQISKRENDTAWYREIDISV